MPWEIQSEPPLSQEEEVALLRDIESGVLARACCESGQGFGDATYVELMMLAERGERARQRFILANVGLVRMVAGQYAARSRLSKAELFQEGCVGLVTAVERFDHAREVRFSTYGLFWIRAYISALTARQLGALNLPATRAEQLRVARGVEGVLAQRFGRAPSIGEVADALGKPTPWTRDLLAHRRPQSLDELEISRLEQVTAEDPQATFDGQVLVRELLHRLDRVHRRVIELRLGFDGDPVSIAQTARTLNIPVSRVRRLEENAMEKLRRVCPQQALAHLR